MAIGWSLLAISAVGGVLVTTLFETAIVVLVGGHGQRRGDSGELATADGADPARQDGVFAGLKAAAESVAIPLSVLVAAEVFLPHFGYRGMFAMLALTITLALVLLLSLVRVLLRILQTNPAGVAKQDRRGGL